MPCSPQVQVSRLIEDRLLWILAMDEKMTPLDCLLPSGTAFQTHIPSPEKHMHTINQIWRFMHRCICLLFFSCCCCFVIHKLYSCVGNPPTHRRSQCIWSKFTLTRITVTLVFLPLLLPLTPTHGLWGIRTQKQITCTFMTTVYICMRHAFPSLLLKGVFDVFALKGWFN